VKTKIEEPSILGFFKCRIFKTTSSITTFHTSFRRFYYNKFLTEQSDFSNGNESGRKPGKKRDKEDAEKDNKKKQKVEDNHKQWRIKLNKNFSELFWKNSSHCPKTKNGNTS